VNWPKRYFGKSVIEAQQTKLHCGLAAITFKWTIPYYGQVVLEPKYEEYFF
jgi:hypothetical protein